MGVRSLRSSSRDRGKMLGEVLAGGAWSVRRGGGVSQEEHYLWSYRARKKPADLR